MKKNVAFTLISFTALKWDDCLSVQLPFELPVQLLLELEPNWIVQNVIELEFELSRMEMKQPKDAVWFFSTHLCLRTFLIGKQILSDLHNIILILLS
jgi:hypothetical protein